jgi:hypothetical protein
MCCCFATRQSCFTICFTICLCISPDLDGNRGTKNEILGPVVLDDSIGTSTALDAGAAPDVSLADDGTPEHAADPSIVAARGCGP